MFCEDLAVDGRLKGDALVLGAMAISKKAEVQGELRARSLTIAEGANVSGVMRIGPNCIPQHDAMLASDAEPSS